MFKCIDSEIRGKARTVRMSGARRRVLRRAYDAAGRMVKEGCKTYRYGYLGKVLSITDGDTTRTYTYHADGQLASANYVNNGRAGAPRTPQSEDFLWDGLALIQRGDEQFMNEPHVGGGNPVASSNGTSYFNDALGTTVGSKSNGKYSAAALTAFGEDLSVNSSGESSRSPFPVPHSPFFTGKPYVEGLGHAFLMRNYRASLSKWQTADPMGYPDGWNQLAYCNNGVTQGVDWLGCAYDPKGLTNSELSELNCAIEMWLSDMYTVGYPVVWWQDKTLTLAFLARYMHESGDQTLDYSIISSEDVIAKSNVWVSNEVKKGNVTPSPYSITGLQWHNSDLSTSIGGCLIGYEVNLIGDSYLIDCTINDPYDFHDNGKTANFPYLGFEGLLAGWGGGDNVYDLWMKQLADKGYAKVFNTKITWQLTVKE